MKKGHFPVKLLISLTACLVLISCNRDEERLPEITDSFVYTRASTSVVVSSTVTDDFDFPPTSRGVCWGTDEEPTVSDNKTECEPVWGTLFSVINGLDSKKNYYARAWARNDAGITYGKTLSFSTLEQIYDIDNNHYNIDSIGQQYWMQENLLVTRYRNGDLIAKIETGSLFWSLTSGAFCIYEYAEEDTLYGYLYNWYSVADSRKICPEGWHVPSDQEWAELTDFLGGSSVAGGHLKEQGTSHWDVYNIAATNSSGFTALPAGCNGYQGWPYGRPATANFWTSTWVNQDSALYRWLFHDHGRIYSSQEGKNYGFSVRCIKD